MSAVLEDRPVPVTCFGCGSLNVKNHCTVSYANCTWIDCLACGLTSGATKTQGGWRPMTANLNKGTAP